MQLVVEISEDTFFDLKKKQNRTEVDNAILNGTPLPKGHWIDSQYDKDFSQCSECGSNWEKLIIENCNMDYCPNCGARMEG